MIADNWCRLRWHRERCWASAKAQLENLPGGRERLCSVKVGGARIGLLNRAALRSGWRQRRWLPTRCASKRERRLSSSAAVEVHVKNASSSITCRTNFKADVRRKMQGNAYAMADYADAKRALDPPAPRVDGSPEISAARSAEEEHGRNSLDAMLRVPDQLRCNLVLHERDRIGLSIRRNRLPQLASGRWR